MLDPSSSRIVLGGPLSGKTTWLTRTFIAQVRDHGIEPEQIVCLSFFPANAEAIRRVLRPHFGERLPWVTTVQRFLTLLLRDHAAAANLPARAKEIDPVTRSLVIQHSWAEVGGPLWGVFGDKPGALRELTKVIDWLSQNRSRFAIAPGELGEHELSQTYCRYIELCLQHRLLTFQEASLRALDVLTAPNVAAAVQARFCVLLVDDLHLARPDQLAFLGRMRGLTTAFQAAGWLNGSHAAPELRYLWDTIQAWGGIELLAPLAPQVNPAIVTAVARLGGMSLPPAAAAGRPIALATMPTVEDEMHAVAQAIVRALREDTTLLPAEIVVVAAEAALEPFVQRVLARHDLPVAQLRPSPLHTPLLRGGLLALRWKLRGADADVERELLSLPYVNVDPIELDALYQAALAHETTILGLAESGLPDKIMPPSLGTLSALLRLAACLAAIDVARLADGAAMAVRELGGVQWSAEAAEFSESQRDAWIQMYSAWLASVRELQETARRIGSAPEDMLALLESLAGATDDDQAAGLIQLVDGSRVNGVHGRLAFVVGLSENAAPVRHVTIQLAEDDALRDLFIDNRPVVVPAARDQEAWIEREARKIAALLTRGHEHLQVSLSHFSADGEVQLPSPFFERLLAPDGELDRRGDFEIHPSSSIWTQVNGSSQTSPEIGLPLLESVPLPGVRPSAGSPSPLDAHIFSASQIRMYLACPLQFFYGRILRIEVDEPGVFNQGSLMHEVLCATVGDGSLEYVDLSGRGRPAWLGDGRQLQRRVSAAFAGAWAGQAVELPGGGRYIPTERWSDRFEHELRRRAVQRWAEQALAQWAEFESEKMAADGERHPILLEAPFTMTVGPYRVRGRIDRIDEVHSETGVTYEVIDYKTGASSNGSLAAQTRKFLPEAGEAPTDFQLPLYGLAVMQGLSGFKVMPNRLSYVFLDSLERGKKGAFSETARRTIILEANGSLNRAKGVVPFSMLQNEISAGLIQTMDAMSASPYLAKPEYHCAWCGFRAACDRGRAYAREAA